MIADTDVVGDDQPYGDIAVVARLEWKGVQHAFHANFTYLITGHVCGGDDHVLAERGHSRRDIERGRPCRLEHEHAGGQQQEDQCRGGDNDSCSPAPPVSWLGRRHQHRARVRTGSSR